MAPTAIAKPDITVVPGTATTAQKKAHKLAERTGHPLDPLTSDEVGIDFMP